MISTNSIKNTLDELLPNNDVVFITPHSRPDFDAIGAAIGMALICKKQKKKCYIIIDDDLEKMDSETKKIIEEIKGCFDVIKSNSAPMLMGEKSLLITVDVNKDYLISPNTKAILNLFNNVVIIDHHKTDEHTIKSNYVFVDDKLSSTCEEVSRLLFSYGVKLSPNFANYLLAGIILDTNKLSKNTSTNTFAVVTKLTTKGADATIANNMFLEDYESDRKMLNIVNNVFFPTYVYAIACDCDDNKIYSVEDIAKAADYLLKYKINASFALGHIDEETVSISARSKGVIDVSSIMKLFNGGGNEYSSAARIKGVSIEEIKNKLELVLNPTTHLDENFVMEYSLKNDEEPPLQLVRSK